MASSDLIDRISPTGARRAGRDAAGLASSPLSALGGSAAELQKLVPEDLTIDTFEGIAYVGVIPFTSSNVRPVFTPPVPGLSRFHEVNVRTLTS